MNITDGLQNTGFSQSPTLQKEQCKSLLETSVHRFGVRTCTITTTLMTDP